MIYPNKYQICSKDLNVNIKPYRTSGYYVSPNKRIYYCIILPKKSCCFPLCQPESNPGIMRLGYFRDKTRIFTDEM